MPSCSYRDVIKRLKKLGFICLRQAKGSHEFWQNPKTKQIILIAKHKKNFPTGTITKVIKELGFKSLKGFKNFK